MERSNGETAHVEHSGEDDANGTAMLAMRVLREHGSVERVRITDRRNRPLATVERTGDSDWAVATTNGTPTEHGTATETEAALAEAVTLGWANYGDRNGER